MNEANCLCHARYPALKIAVEELAAKHHAMPAADRDTVWWTWAIGQINGLVGVVRTPNLCVGAAIVAENCVCHSEYTLLRAGIIRLLKYQHHQRKQLEAHPKERVNAFERYISELQLLGGMCRMCMKDGDIAAKKEGDGDKKQVQQCVIF